MTDKPEVMTGESLDIAAQRRSELKQLFPGVFTETKDENGNVVSSIDFERLKAELGSFSDIYEGRRERYGMEWPGKRDCMKVIQEPSRATLKPCPEESVDWDTTKNLFIEGDNLEVLKLLQKSYYGKVKMIYIDPPYNTGNEFIYPDNYQETIDTYLAYTGLLDDDGKKFSTNTASEGRYHSKWLNMMYPRLFLARNFLRDDGVIFISIDDNEVENLKRICNEIFGEENFVSLISRPTGTRMGSGSRGISRELDYLLIYTKNPEFHLRKLPMTDEEMKLYNEQDDNGRYVLRSLRRTGGENRREDRPSMFFPVIDPDGNEVFPLAPEGWESRWVCNQNTYDELVQAKEIVWKKVKKNDVDKWQVYQKIYMNADGKEATDLWAGISGNKKATREVNGLFGGVKIFDNPKPVELIQRAILQSTHPNEEHIILDFFAGSGTTGHAVLQQNLADNGNRKFILVQLPEPLKDDSNAFKKGYKTIAKITLDRLKFVSERFAQSNETTDLGFRVFALNKSNFSQWNNKSITDADKLVKQLEIHIDNLDTKANQKSILFELIIKAGFELSEGVKEYVFDDLRVFSVCEGALLICLEDRLTTNLIDEILRMEPMQFICLDKGFQGNDQLKANTAQAFKARSQNSEAEMVFKVV